MHAKEHTCQIIENIWVTPTVMRIRFIPLKKFNFEAGQFISVLVPAPTEDVGVVKRCYSLASSPSESKEKGYYELCVKYVPGGAGTTYFASLKKGDTFRIAAPYGDFKYEAPSAGRGANEYYPATGFAPFRSMVFSKEFQENFPAHAICLFGVREESELMYRGDMESKGVETIYAVSQASEKFTGFKGRVTDVLRKLPQSWKWHTTDFYLCGNGEMVTEVNEFLRAGHGVSEKAIRKEAFSLVTAPKAAEKKAAENEVSLLSLIASGKAA